MNKIISYLFKTNALRICPENKPFWYTSGKIGPYYINTHFLYGNENDAVNLLKFIDEEKNNHLEMPKKVFEKVLAQYNNDSIYNEVINSMASFIKENINIDEVDYVSGGERRDWFFSNIIAYLLNKPHITIYKDLSVVVSTYDFSKTEIVTDLSKKKVLHIADLITEASSYIRAWIPAIRNLGANLCWSTVVVDRMQGGTDRLVDQGIKALSIIKINEELFEEAYNSKIINESQLNMLNNFYKDPDNTMKAFIKAHPEFLENALNSDEKTASRAKLCIESKFYTD